MSRFMKVYEPVEEGWGYIAAILFGGATFGVSAASYAILHWANLKSVMNNPAIQKYLIKQCDELLAKAKKTYKDATPKVPGNPLHIFKQSSALLKNSGNWLARLKNPSGGKYEVGKYTIVPFGDTDHVERMVVLFYLTDSKQYVSYQIKAPTKEELQQAGFKKEERD